MCRNLILITLTFLSIGLAESETQTDWSGGPGGSDPVEEWASSFSSSARSNWLYLPGDVLLSGEYIDPIQHDIGNSFQDIERLISADMDMDGDQDLVFSAWNWSGTPDSVVWMENTSLSGSIWPEHTITVKRDPIHCIEVCDIDGDGKLDLLACAFGTGTNVYWFRGDGTGLSWIENAVTGNLEYITAAHAADVDKDGDMDVVTGTYFYNVNGMSWWENIDGLGQTWSQHVINSGYSGAVSIDHLDADGDGDVDIAVNASYVGNDIVWWENLDGAGLEWSEHFLTNHCFDDGLLAVDVDMDNDQDLLVSGSAGNRIGFWRNTNGAGLFEYFNIAYGDVHAVSASDYDYDGDIDVSGSLWNHHRVRLWENLSEITEDVWVEREIGDLCFAHTIEAVDIDGDSFVELVANSDFPDSIPRIRYWEILQAGESGWLESSILHVKDCEPEWLAVDWSSQEPEGSSISIRVRSSDNPLSLGDWSDTMPVPGNLPESVSDGDNYFQYRVWLEAGDNPYESPTLESITVSWNPSSSEISSNPVDPVALLPFSPNPCCSNPIIRFSLSSPSMIEFNLFDVSGRLVVGIPIKEYPSGLQTVQLNSMLPAGVYHCRMSADGFTSTQRFAVLR